MEVGLLRSPFHTVGKSRIFSFLCFFFLFVCFFFLLLTFSSFFVFDIWFHKIDG